MRIKLIKIICKQSFNSTQNTGQTRHVRHWTDQACKTLDRPGMGYQTSVSRLTYTEYRSQSMHSSCDRLLHAVYWTNFSLDLLLSNVTPGIDVVDGQRFTDVPGFITHSGDILRNFGVWPVGNMPNPQDDARANPPRPGRCFLHDATNSMCGAIGFSSFRHVFTCYNFTRMCK